jgi:hypothetical protein
MATYLDQTLQPGEAVEYRARLSRVALLGKPLVWMLVFLYLRGLLPNDLAGHPAESGWQTVVGTILTLGVVWSLLGLVRGYFYLKTSFFVLTDRRILAKYGWIRRRTYEALFTNVRGVNYKESLLGRVFGYGRVSVVGGHSFANIKKPREFRNAVFLRLEQSKLLHGTAAYTLSVRMETGGQPDHEPPPVPAHAESPERAQTPGSSARYCPNCGTPSQPSSRFCASCGHPQG